MSRVGRQLLLALVTTSVLAIPAAFGAAAGAQPPAGQVSFSEPTLFPSFAPSIRDYVVRCNNGPVTVTAHAAGGWEVKIASHPYQSGDFSETVSLSAGQAFIVTVRKVGDPEVYRYHVRCLPGDFPTYNFTRYGPVSPKYFVVENVTAGFEHRYAIIFDNRGVPMWWYKAPTHDAKVLPSGNVLWFAYGTSPVRWEIRRLNGGLVRSFSTVGPPANDHDAQVLSNGDGLVGAYVQQRHVDTSAYGGSSDADVANAELQQVTPAGGLVWDWKSEDHISLAETGRHWPGLVNDPGPLGYDITHWNSIEPAGNSVIASFRQLDAVYKIRKSTGNIVWKLGGTRRPESLRVKNDPRPYTFGAQHDARLLPDGTLTVFDNRSGLDQHRPRAVRFRINEQTRTATLLESITDPNVTSSQCCGSARRLGNGDWLISWGGGGKLIAGYKPNDERTFVLRFDSTRTYRANPVPAGVLAPSDLRQGMNAIYGGGGG
jgi:hypothetical protein